MYICDGCIGLCQEILAKGAIVEAADAADATAAPVCSSEARAVGTLSKEELSEAVKQLPYRERRVLELRYGLSGEQPRTLDEVGATFELTREQVRQIENQALGKLHVD